MDTLKASSFVTYILKRYFNIKAGYIIANNVPLRDILTKEIFDMIWHGKIWNDGQFHKIKEIKLERKPESCIK